MSQVHCYGVIPVCAHQVLVVHNKNGYWGLPKGHSEPGEKPTATALRELAEETGITDIKLNESHSFIEHYQFPQNGKTVNKTVTYYVGFANSKEVSFTDELITGGEWLSIDDAIGKITYEESKNILRQAKPHISN